MLDAIPPLPAFSLAEEAPLKPNQARLLLAHLRGGYYAHAGDKEAIELMINKGLEFEPKILEGPCLDVGSGFGGTANDFYTMGFQSIQGIDLDSAAVSYSQNLYPHIPFLHLDAKESSKAFEKNFFSFIYLFNVIYAVEDKATVLTQLHTIAKPGALLAIFDYTSLDHSFDFKDLANRAMHPIVLPELKAALNEIGWDVIESVDLSSDFLRWYEQLLNKLENDTTLSERFAEEDIQRVKTTFTTMHHWLSSSYMGGTLIFCRKIEK